ncbi:MAG: hypothetical protein LBH04_04575 [Tannerellaceae bacterium]|nr:hypothetical protein [Tannerellaceae bacterium]
MKRALLLIFLITGAINLCAQQDFTVFFDRSGKAIAIPKANKYDFNIPEYSLGKYAKLESSSVIDSGAGDDALNPVATLPVNVQILSSAYRPYFNPFMPLMKKSLPTAFDFREISVMQLNEKIALVTVGERETWPFLAGQTSFDAMLAWQHERLSIAGGAFISKFYTPFNLSPALSGGVNLDLKYELGNRVALRGWGKYTLYEGNERMNPYLYSLPIYNYSGVGAAVEYMFSESFGMGGGVEYQFNYHKGRMEPRPVIYPVFKIGKVSIGVR